MSSSAKFADYRTIPNTADCKKSIDIYVFKVLSMKVLVGIAQPYTEPGSMRALE